MKTPLRHKWALRVAREYCKPAPALAAMPYMSFAIALLLAATVVVVLIKSEGKFSQLSILDLMLPFFFFIVSFVMGLIVIERRAFSELLAARDEEIQKLKGNPPIEHS